MAINRMADKDYYFLPGGKQSIASSSQGTRYELEFYANNDLSLTVNRLLRELDRSGNKGEKYDVLQAYKDKGYGDWTLFDLRLGNQELYCKLNHIKNYILYLDIGFKFLWYEWLEYNLSLNNGIIEYRGALRNLHVMFPGALLPRSHRCLCIDLYVKEGSEFDNKLNFSKYIKKITGKYPIEPFGESGVFCAKYRKPNKRSWTYAYYCGDERAKET